MGVSMTDDEQARPTRPFHELRDEGLLWLINRAVFHPRGFALAVDRDENGVVVGWSMLGDGTECWSFTEESDDRNFAKAEAFLNSLRPAAEQPDLDEQGAAVCELCDRPSGEHFPFAPTLLPGVMRQQGRFLGEPGPYCPLLARPPIAPERDAGGPSDE